MYAASSSVNVMTLDSHHIHRVADNLNQVVGICYNAGYIYWTDISKQVESVMRSRIFGSPEVYLLLSHLLWFQIEMVFQCFVRILFVDGFLIRSW